MNDLPEELKNILSVLLVDRRGHSNTAFMKTEKIIGYIEPNKNYMIMSNSIIESSKNQTEYTGTIAIPQHVKIFNNWNSNKNANVKNNNILGENGDFQIDSNLKIPIAETTQENLMFYNCKLIKHNDIIQFESPKILPITIMKIGEKYVDDFLLTELGDGCYLEYHDTPHFHMSLNNESNGYLIIGKIINNYCYLSAFNIPFGYAIYMPPNVIHCDAFLIGDYLVMYTLTPNYSTVVLKNNDKIANIKIF